MPFTRIAGTAATSTNNNDVTTPAIDTTTADLLIGWGAWDTAAGALVFTDSKGNSWNKLISRVLTIEGSFWWCVPTSVGTGHTFTGTRTGSNPAICIEAWINAAASPFDQQNGNTSGVGTTLTTGSVTPTQNDELIVAGIAIRSGSTSISSIDSSFTIRGNVAPTGTSDGAAIATLVQVSIVLVNPTWTVAGSGSVKAAAIATFKTVTPSVGNSGNMFSVF